ncbi:MAG: DUF1080 domain-containing protein [Verrucomicrobia bacterium]|nr:DUF1080 domain-containing protein [Verrucomicrobiota bacterium]
MNLFNDWRQPSSRGWCLIGVAMLLAAGVAGCRTAVPDPGYRPVFDQASLLSWDCVPGGDGAFEIQEGILMSRPGRIGRLFTEREYADFHLRFEFQTESGATCGLVLRASAEGDPEVLGIEIQLGSALDNSLDALGGHGVVTGLGQSQGGYLRGSEQWNRQEIICEGRRIRSMVNGRLIQDLDLNRYPDPEIFLRRPGLLREKGQIGLVARGGRVMLRGLSIKELPRPFLLNMAPDGFQLLFDGRTLRNWEGLVADPPKRAAMSVGESKVARIQADHLMTRNWEVYDGALVYRGKGFDNLCTRQEFGNFELLVDWSILAGSDSGVYLRGSPQVQIWDQPTGSGGLFNNQKHPSQPRLRADRYPSSWNRFQIIMVGERVTVLLNDELVVHNVVMENYWERDRAIYERGPVELQAHETPVAFRNICIRELP